MTSTSTIEQLWQALRSTDVGSRQRRVDASHPLDLYADFEPPDRFGMVAVCRARPPQTRPLRALAIEQGQRSDGRWSLRLSLLEPRLLPVFAALCRDIIASTRSDVDEEGLAGAILARLDRWRTLLEKDAAGLGETALRGLIGELLVLETHVLDSFSLREGAAAWTGPQGTPQDFLLPSGTRIEVKTIGRDAESVRVSGLGQLDSGSDPLMLAVVRVEPTGPSASGAVTASMLVGRLRQRFAPAPDALAGFDATLACAGWHEHAAHDEFALRPIVLEAHDVGESFPRLIRASVPTGIVDADYTLTLPLSGRTAWRWEA